MLYKTVQDCTPPLGETRDYVFCLRMRILLIYESNRLESRPPVPPINGPSPSAAALSRDSSYCTNSALPSNSAIPLLSATFPCLRRFGCIPATASPYATPRRSCIAACTKYSTWYDPSGAQSDSVVTQTDSSQVCFFAFLLSGIQYYTLSSLRLLPPASCLLPLATSTTILIPSGFGGLRPP